MSELVSLNPMPGPNGARMIDVRRTVRRLIGAMAGSLILTAATTALLIAIAGRPGWWSGWIAALIAGALAASLSLALVIPAVVAGMPWTVYGFLAGSVVRMIAALGACVAAVVLFRAPPVPTLLLIVPIYFCQMIVEIIILGRAILPRG